MEKQGARTPGGGGARPILLRLGALAFGLLVGAIPAHAAPFVVNSTGDGGAVVPANDGFCDADPTPAVVCTLRAAIEEANASPGADTITFSIAPATISPGSAYPNITETVTIDASPSYIEIDGTSAGVANGLTLSGAASSNSTIRALVINRFQNAGGGYAIRILNSSNNVVAGNLLGTDPTGLVSRPNRAGVIVQSTLGNPTSNNRIGGTVVADRNIISANLVDGMQITGSGATGNDIEGNYIGVDAGGATPLGNASNGIAIFGSADNNTVGGTVAGARNVISGNGNLGIGIAQAGTTGNVVVGNRIGTNAAGTASIPNLHGVALQATASNNTIGGTAGFENVISGNNSNGILVDNADNNVIESNRIGTDPAGTADVGNVQHGIQILNTSSGNRIELNVISGNNLNGVDIVGAGTSGNRVINNIIGLDASGTADLGNTEFGVAIAQSANGNIIGEPGGGNVISRNGMAGVRIVDQNTDNNLVQLNYIGLDISGTLPQPNVAQGVILDSGAGPASGNIIGGAGLGNVISGNGTRGIEVRQQMTGTVIAGNLIGTDATGLTGVGNGSHGVYFAAGASGNTVGGTGAGERNVISDNGGQGIRVDGAGTNNNVVAGNFIGTDSTGSAPLGNVSGGIAITNAAASTTVGGVVGSAGNVIAYNATYGINVAAGAGTANAILGNSIYENLAELGIDLAHEPGVTANDVGDVDVGGNGLQNFPVLSAAATNEAGTVHVAGSLNSSATTWFRIEFFASSAIVGADPSGFGEGERYLGFVNVTTDGAGDAVIGTTLGALVMAGELVTATATVCTDGMACTMFGDTSEFSAAILAYASVIVTTTADTVVGSDTSSVSNLIINPGADGRISLREAIIATNNTAGTDTIRFGIPLTDANHLYYKNDMTPASLVDVQPATLADTASPSSVAIPDFDPDYPAGFTRSWYRIQPSGSPLPDITGAVTVDAETQPGFIVGAPVIELDGSAAGSGNGLTLTTGPSTVRGLVANGFPNEGLHFEGPDGFTVTGNYVGTDVSGTLATGNGASGVFISKLTLAPSTIGGSTLATRNIISANGVSGPSYTYGIFVYNYYPPANTQPVRIQGNYIGTDVTGMVGLGVQTRGIVLEFTGGHVIGGPNPGEGNLISGNAGPGIDMNGDFDTGGGAGAPADNNTIEGNWIGVDATGTGPLPNTGPGIQFYGTRDATSSSSGNTIRGNVFAAATGTDPHGIVAWGNTDNNVIEDNFIGTDAGGTVDLGNAGSGIHIQAVSTTFPPPPMQIPTGNTIRNNVIRFNDLDGVRLLGDGTTVTLEQNRIWSNDGLGIDLGGDGVTANDWGVADVDTGPNDLMNFPTMGPPIETAGTLSVDFGLDLAAGFYRVEFFKNPSGADASGYGEGEAFASAIVVQHMGTGLEAFNHTFAGVAGDVITATTTFCTDGVLACNAPGSTSEFGLATLAVTTVVELVSFTAVGEDEAVLLEWRTASELDNLGFHLYRGPSEQGPWTRITPSLIPGLGSSPEGASYSFRDTGLTNGVRYFYRLEDVDAHSGSSFHGPVSAVPEAASSEEDGDSTDGESDVAPKTYGHPEETSWRVVSRNKNAVVVELQTGGFVATSGSDGLHVSVPGFDQRTDPAAPDLPLKRVVLDAVVGRAARIDWVQEKKTLSFAGLRPAAVGSPEIVSSADGTVHPGRRPARLRAEGLVPPFAAGIAGDAFLGETKKLALEMNPLRYDTSTDTLLLARRLRVKITFDRRAASEEAGRGARGRRRPRSVPEISVPALAHLHTSTKGLYAVSFGTLFPGGQETHPLDTLRLSLQGRSVSFHVEPDGRPFGPGSVFFFYASAEAASTDFTSEVAYALEQVAGGTQMALVSASPKGSEPSVSAPLAEVTFERNRFYQAGLLEAPDPWLWDFVVGGTSKSFPLSVEGLDPTSTLPARLQVRFQGASEAETEGEHHLSVSLNGTPVGETTFDGKRPHVFSASVPAALLRDGENTLSVTNLGDAGAYSFVFLDRVDLVHPRRPALRSGLFSGIFPETGRAVVSGEASVGVDVADPDAPVWLTRLRLDGGGVSFTAQAGHRYVLASPEGLLTPRVSRPLPSTLRQSSNQADYVLIAPEAFLGAAEPLLEGRREQGLTTRAISLEEIASEFGYGRASAQAIRDALAYAYHTWQQPSLRYVLLLGDSSYDPRNFTGLDKGAPLPAMWVKTSYLWTASDPTLGAVNGEDLLPDVAVGRLPARTLEEARALVEKMLAWEDTVGDLGGTAVLVADNPDVAGDFEADLLDIRSSFLGGRETKTVFLRQVGGGTRGEILASFDEGASLMSYVGHGGPAVWASENVLNSWDTKSLLAQSSQPLMLTFNCLNGYFVAPNYDSLSEAFLKAEGRGTIGAFSPSGLSLNGPAHHFHRALMAQLTGGGHERLGDAVLAAQASYAETGLMPELLSIYHLLADPGMTIR